MEFYGQRYDGRPLYFLWGFYKEFDITKSVFSTTGVYVNLMNLSSEIGVVWDAWLQKTSPDVLFLLYACRLRVVYHFTFISDVWDRYLYSTDSMSLQSHPSYSNVTGTVQLVTVWGCFLIVLSWKPYRACSLTYAIPQNFSGAKVVASRIRKWNEVTTCGTGD